MPENPIPIEVPIGYTPADPASGRSGVPVFVDTQAWHPYLLSRETRANATPERKRTLRLQALQASIGATALAIPGVIGGLYRVTWRIRITQVATTSSTVAVTIGWTEAALAMTKAFAAITGNTVTTNDSGSVLARLDSASPLTYATAYGSVGAQPMQYELELVVEQIPG